MVKYWTRERIQKERKRIERREQRAYEESTVQREKARTHSKGDERKNTRLQLEVLGVAIKRKILARIKRDGPLSVSNIADPFRLTVQGALKHIDQLRRAGLVSTYKRGRIRYCTYAPGSLEELGRSLSKGGALLE